MISVSDEEAFSILRRASQRMNVKLRDVAQQVVEGSVTAPEVAGDTGTAVDG